MLFGAQHLQVPPILHLDFSNDAGNTVDAGAFSDVVDLSGNGYHATQATAGYRPTKMTMPNGLSFARFADNSTMAIPAIPQVSGQVVIMVGSTALTGTGNRYFLGSDSGDGPLLLVNSAAFGAQISALWNGSTLGSGSQSDNKQGAGVFRWKCSDNGTDKTVRPRVDSRSSWNTSSTAVHSPLYDAWEIIGAYPGDSDGGFDCYEILILPDNTPDGDIELLLAGLAWKWGIEAEYEWGNLPFDSAPPLHYAGGSSITDVVVTDTTASSVTIRLTSDFAYPEYVSIMVAIFSTAGGPMDPPVAQGALPPGSLTGPGDYDFDFSATPLDAGSEYVVMAQEVTPSAEPGGMPVQEFGFYSSPTPFTATAGAPAATPLTVGGMSQTQQQGAAGVSPAAAVQPAGMAQGQSISDLGLAHTYAVTPSLMRQAHSIEKAATYAAIWIVAGNIRQIQRMTGIELTARYPVTVHDAKQGQALNIANLESNYMLAIQTLLQAQGQDEIAIDPSYPLTVAAISQAQGIKAPSSLTAHGVLALNHMTQEQTEALVEAGGAIISFEGGHIVVRRKLGRRSISAWHLH
ncbi:MAG: hypothetical protein CME38_01285 [Haliea sp.]|nr:hypothetical protein [Haliea sp.]|tara:strand:+ start:1605 stop:3326 length:1722 start_codon:yes stop_codon:yes gene_type:complete